MALPGGAVLVVVSPASFLVTENFFGFVTEGYVIQDTGLIRR